MPEILDMEARIKDYVSVHIDKIEKKIKSLEKTTDVASKRTSADIKKVGMAAQQSSVGVKQLGLSFNNVQSSIMIAAATLTTIGIALKNTIKDASDLNETISKSDVVFGASAKTIERWAETAATSFGQSKKAALDAAGTFAVFGQSAGLAGKELVEFSTILTELASDFASFYNTRPEDAMIAIAAALRGEFEPIRRYNVLLNEASLRQAAFKMGIIDTTKKALTPQQRTLAAYSEIMRQSQIAQGDFKRTQDQLANIMRTNEALMKSISATIGTKFLPTAEKAARALREFLQVAKELAEKDYLAKFVDFLSEAAIKTTNLIPPLAAFSAALQTLKATIKDTEKEVKTSFSEMQKSKQEYERREKPKRDAARAQQDELVALEKKMALLESEVTQLERISIGLDQQKLVTEEMAKIDAELAREKEEKDRQIFEEGLLYEQQIHEAKLMLRQIEIESMENGFQKELAALELKYQEEQRLYEDNQVALAIIREKYELETAQVKKQAAIQDKKMKNQAFQNEINNLDRASNYTFSTLSNIHSAVKASSADQKALDVAQATANTFLGITKAVATNRYWEIPFITALGFAQVANIQAQKYQAGGIVPGTSISGDSVPALLNAREAVFTMEDQRTLFDIVRRPQTVNNNSQAINLNINVGSGTYDMSAARYTVDQLVPVIGEALVKAKNEGRLREYETA